MFVTYLSYHRKRRGFKYDWQPGQRPAATVHQLPVAPRLVPIFRPRPDQMPTVDHQELIDLLRKQVELMPDRLLGTKLQMSFRALELEVGEAEASRQVWAIVGDYIKEAA